MVLQTMTVWSSAQVAKCLPLGLMSRSITRPLWPWIKVFSTQSRNQNEPSVRWPARGAWTSLSLLLSSLASSSIWSQLVQEQAEGTISLQLPLSLQSSLPLPTVQLVYLISNIEYVQFCSQISIQKYLGFEDLGDVECQKHCGPQN